MQRMTRRRTAKHARLEDALRYRLLFENSMDGVVLTEIGGGILAANAGAQRIFGCSEDALRRLGRQNFPNLSDRPTLDALAERAKTGWFRGELMIRRPDAPTAHASRPK